MAEREDHPCSWPAGECRFSDAFAEQRARQRRAEDAASKGDAARERAAGMELQISELKAALAWALNEGACVIGEAGDVSIIDSGCGCCADDIKPPDEISAVVAEAVNAVLEKRKATK